MYLYSDKVSGGSKGYVAYTSVQLHEQRGQQTSGEVHFALQGGTSAGSKIEISAKQD